MMKINGFSPNIHKDREFLQEQLLNKNIIFRKLLIMMKVQFIKNIFWMKLMFIKSVCHMISKFYKIVKCILLNKLLIFM